MSNPSEIKLLRDELARVIAEVKKRDGALERVEAQNAQLRVQIEQKDIQIEQLKGQPDKGRGAHHILREPAQPPVRQLDTRKAEKEGLAEGSRGPQEAGAETRTRGRPAQRRSSATVRHTPAACGGCGGGRLEAGRIAGMRQATDIRPVPDADTVTRVAHDGVCGRCGHATEAPSLYRDGIGVAVRGTSLGPVLVSGAVQLWERHASISGITDMLNDAFGAGIGRAAVLGAPAAAGVALQAAGDGIAGSLGGAPNLKADETPYGFLHGSGYAWTVIGGGLRRHARPAVARRPRNGRHRAVL